MVENHTELVENKRITSGVVSSHSLGGVEGFSGMGRTTAHLIRRNTILQRKLHVVQSQMLHAQEELRKMTSLKQSCCSTVRRDSLVMLTLCSERVCKPYPGRR